MQDLPQETLVGQRNTRQKRLILACLQEQRDQHISADEIIELLKASGLAVGKATVYRVLKQLEEEGVVKRYQIAEGVGACYQYVGRHSVCNEHYHLLCSGCGAVTHVDSDLIRRFTGEMLQQHQFQIDERKTVFYGVCSRCANR